MLDVSVMAATEVDIERHTSTRCTAGRLVPHFNRFAQRRRGTSRAALRLLALDLR